MELDDLKEAWTALDNRLKRNEELKESIILEMMQSKANKSINRLIKWDIFGVTALLLFIPFNIFMFDQFRGNFLMWDILMICLVIYCIVFSPWILYKILRLMRIDFSKDIHNNIYHMNRYNIQVKRERILQYFIMIPVLCILTILTYATMGATFSLWVFLISMFIIAALISYWSYKKIYGKNIDSIIKSLNEIKELKEE